MSVYKNTSANKDHEVDNFRPSSSLFALLDAEIAKNEDFYLNLGTEYTESVYKQFEDRFIGLRNKFKAKLQDISDPDYDYINHTEMRKYSIEQIIMCSTFVAAKFQEARENSRLDRPSCTDALENLIFAIKNLKHLIEEQGKI